MTPLGMVATRRRSQAIQVSSSPAVKEVKSNEGSMKKAAKGATKNGLVKKQKKEMCEEESNRNDTIVREETAQNTEVQSEQRQETRKRRPPIRYDSPEDTEKKPLGTRSLPAVETHVEEKKPRIEQKSPVSSEKRGKRKMKASKTDENVESVEDGVADALISSVEGKKLELEQAAIHKENKSVKEERMVVSEKSLTETKAEEAVTRTAKQNPSLKEEEEEWENFGNTSDEDESNSVLEPAPKKKKVKSKTAAPKPTKKAAIKDDATRRSGRNVVRKSYAIKDEDGDESSSSSPASESESEAPSSAVASSELDTETEISSVDEDPEDSDASFTPSETKQPVKQSGKKGGGGRGRQSGGTKSEGRTRVPWSGKSTKSGAGGSSTSKTPSTKLQSARPASSKPLKPWQKLNEPVVQGDIVLPPRNLRKGERKMAKFRIFAAALAVGRNREMTQEESNRILDGMRVKAKVTSKARAPSPTAVPENEKVSDEGASSSEDEWEEMEPVDVGDGKGKSVQITLKKAEEKDWWALYLRQEVNKCVRENWENCHKVHILCYIAHLQYLKKVILEESLIPSLMLTKMPAGYQALVGETITVENARKMVKYFHSAFKASGAPITFEPGLCRFDATARYAEMVSQQEFETDADRAALLFALFVSMECVTRICVNTQTIPRKWDADVLKSIKKMKEKSVSTAAPAEKKSKSKVPSKKKSGRGDDHRGMVRNYWVEYWDKRQNKWICVDPLRASVDEPNSIEENVTKPVVYVLAIDNEGGVREVTARYAADYSRPEFRRRRTDQTWLCSTLRKKMIRPDLKKAKLEDVQLRQELVNKPLPATLSEYKNHPLYVLEKDLLKFEALYPRAEDQKPLGEVRGHKVYPRSTVYTLQSTLNWIKMARSVKEDEKPYKVVKARPNLRIPAEEREPKFLDIFGYWQTEPYRRPKVTNGRIPCNEFGNVYMYVPSMVPIGAVHLRLPGLPSIARRLGGLECVPAVVGWDFNSGTNFPIMDGACVLEEDAEKFVAEWKRLEATREERENKRREERVLGHWRKLIRGILRLHYVKSKFAATKEKTKGKKKKHVKEETEEESCVIDRTVVAERQVFTHDDLMKLKH